MILIISQRIQVSIARHAYSTGFDPGVS